MSALSRKRAITSEKVRFSWMRHEKRRGLLVGEVRDFTDCVSQVRESLCASHASLRFVRASALLMPHSGEVLTNLSHSRTSATLRGSNLSH